MSNKKSIAQNAVFNISYKLLNVIFPLISSAYISRIIRPEGVGKVAYAQNIVSYFVLIASIGIPSYGLREIAKTNGDPYKRSKIFSELFILNFSSTTICVIAYYAMIFLVPRFHVDIQLYMITGLLLIFNWINIDWLYQGMEEYRYIAFRSAAIKIASFITLLVLVKNSTDYKKYAFIVCMATGGNYLFNVIHCKKYVQLILDDLNLTRHLKSVLYLLICTISTELYSKIDITMLGGLHSDAIVGYYSNAQKAINIIITFAIAVTSVFLPRLSLLYKENKKEFDSLVNKGVRIILLIALPCMIGVMFIANEMVEVLFGKEFLPAAVTIRILALLIIIKGFGDLLTYQVVIASGNENKLVKAYVTAAIGNITLNALLIPKYLQNGAAVASVIGEFIVFALLLPTTCKVTKLDSAVSSSISILASCGIMIGGLFVIEFMPIVFYVKLLVKIGVGVVTYFGALIFFRDVTIMELMKLFRRKIKNV